MAFGTPAEFWTMRLYNVIAGQNNRRSKPWTNGITEIRWVFGRCFARMWLANKKVIQLIIT